MILLSGIFKWVSSVAGVGSILIILMIIFRKFFKRRVESRFLNLLWILILIKLVIPMNIESNFSMYQILNWNEEIKDSKNINRD